MSNIYRSIGVIMALFLFSISAHAGFALVKPPPGYSFPKVPGTPGTFKTGPAANDNTYKGSTVLTNGALNVGGQVVTVPVSMRIAANAATIGATFAFGNPAIFAGLAITSAAYLYYKQNGLIVENGEWVKDDQTICSTAPCFMYRLNAYGYDTGPQSSENAACVQFAAGVPRNAGFSNKSGGVNYSRCKILQSFNGNQYNEYELGIEKITIAPQTPKRVPVGDIEFHEIMDPVPVPKDVPKELPDVPWPYETPVINPDPSTIPSTHPSPATAPSPNPFWLPTGDPVKNPNPDPANQPDTWTQPGIRVKPSPTPQDPLRVDVQPESITKLDPSPSVSDKAQKTEDTTPPETKSLCEEFPDILACAKLGNAPAPTAVPNVNKTAAITKDGGWGPENGNCPAPRVLNLHFLTLTVPWTLICNFATGIRPFVIGLAFLGAAFTFFGIGRKD